MKKCIFTAFLTLVLSLYAHNVWAADIFKHPANAVEVSKQMPDFESTKCKFTQNKYMTASKINLVSGGNFQFIKNQGVSFETTYPIHSETSYTTANNKNINAIVKSIINKNFTYIEKNFEIYYMKLDNSKWIFALKPKVNSPLNRDLKNILINGETQNSYGIITKMVISTENNTTTISFTQCG